MSTLNLGVIDDNNITISFSTECLTIEIYVDGNYHHYKYSIILSDIDSVTGKPCLGIDRNIYGLYDRVMTWTHMVVYDNLL